MQNPANLFTFLVRPFLPLRLPFFLDFISNYGLGVILLVFLYLKIDFDLILNSNVIMFGVLLGAFIQPESRQFINVFPILPVLIASYLTQQPQQKLSFNFCVVFFILSFLYSLVWIPNLYPHTMMPFLQLHAKTLSVPIATACVYVLLHHFEFIGQRRS